MPSVSRVPRPRLSIGALDAGSASRVIGAAADLAVAVDRNGVVRGCVFRSSDIEQAIEDARSWAGRAWTETMTVESRPKAQALLEAALNDAAPHLRHLNHRAAVGGEADIAIEYAAVRAQKNDIILAFGRDLRPLATLQQRLMQAQQALERDYAALQHIQARYRVLFATAPEPLMLLDAQNLAVIEANPPGRQLIEARQPDPAHASSPGSLAELFHPEDRRAVTRYLGALRTSAPPEPLSVRLTPVVRGGAGPGPETVLLAGDLLLEDGASLLAVRILPNRRESRDVVPAGINERLLAALELAPDGFVLTGVDGRVLMANAAFLGLAQVASPAGAQGRPLEDWVGQSGVDVDVLLANLRQRGAVRLFHTSLRGEHGLRTQVEISASAVEAGGQRCFGLLVRDVSNRLAPPVEQQPGLPRSVEQLTELIGRMSLKDLVRDATDVIERLCIETALELTGNNRASAAEMLGISRQSLYVKLRRYGLAEPEEENGP